MLAVNFNVPVIMANQVSAVIDQVSIKMNHRTFKWEQMIFEVSIPPHNSPIRVKCLSQSEKVLALS